MHKGVCALAMAGSLVASPAISAATLIMIDGQLAADISDFDGGDPRATVVSTPLPDGTVDKHVGAVTYAPLTIHVPLSGLAKPVFDWIGKLASGQSTTATLQIIDAPSDPSKTASAIEYAGAVLVEVQLPVLDESNAATGDVALVVQVAQGKAVQPAGKPSSARLVVANAGFRLTVSGLDGRGVYRIEPVAFRRAQPKAPLEMSNLVVTLTEASSAGWRTWFNDFVVTAASKDEKSGSLQFVNSTSGTAAGQIDFGNLGIVRLSKLNGGAAYQAELYFEKASTATDTSKTTSTASKALLSTTTDPPPAIGAAGAGRIAAVAGADAPSAGAGATVSRTSVTGVRTATSAPTEAATIVNSADAGTRDPAQFPRVSGLTRLSYSGTFQTGYTSEDATYTTTESFGTLVQRVDAAAKAAGWTLGTLQEGTSGDGKTTAARWTKGGATASLDFHEFVGDSTRMNLVVYVTLGQ